MTVLSFKYKSLYLIIPIFIILVPTFPTVFPELMGFQIVFAAEILIVFACLFKKVFKPQLTPEILVLFSYFFFSTLLSLSIDIVRSVITVSDFFELAKPVAFVLFFWLYRYSTVDTETLIGYTQKAVLFVFIFLAIFSICAFIYPSVFRDIEFILYKRSTVLVLNNKAIGSFSTTYHFAFCLLLPLAYSFIKMVKHHSLKYIIFFVVIFCTMLLTQSRSMYICSAVCILICAFLPILHNSIKQSLSTISFFLIVLLGLLMIYFSFQEELSKTLSYAFTGIEAMSEGNNNSVNVRGSQIAWAIDNNKLMLFGCGIGKGEIMLESFYALYYYRYGLIGCFAFLFMVLYMAFRSFQIAKSYKNKEYAVFFYALSVFYFISPLSIMSSCHMDTPKISFLFYGLMGLILNKSSKLNTSNHVDAKSI